MQFFGIALYLGALLLIGVLASRRMKDLRDYFAAGKDLGFLAVAFSARSSKWLELFSPPIALFRNLLQESAVLGKIHQSAVPGPAHAAK